MSDFVTMNSNAPVHADEHKSSGHDSWFCENIQKCFDVGIYDSTRLAWTTAQNEERERVKSIIRDMVGTTSREWTKLCGYIIEQIDEQST
jgi:hypothetical protein